MSELDKRLDKIEQQLHTISSHQAPVLGNVVSARSDEIDLRELFTVFWQGKWWIVAITFLFAVVGVFYALSLPNMYKSEGIYAPSQKQGSNTLGGQLGGLASLAGVSLGEGESNDIDQAIALITSWPFLERVINKHKLKPLIMGVKGWNRKSGELVWDEDVYDPVDNKWLREPPEGGQPEPNSFETYMAFKNMISIKYDNKVGMITIGVEYFSPAKTKELVLMLADEVNFHFKERDQKESTQNIEYLKSKIAETSIAEMHEVFYGMIEVQLKTLMLAEVDEQYLIEQIVEPMVPEIRSAPNRNVIIGLSLFLGMIFSCVAVIGRNYLATSNAR